MSLSASADLQVMLHPFRQYRQLAGQLDGSAPLAGDGMADRVWRGLSGPLKLLLALSCFVAFTTSGRLTWDHMLFVPLSWAFVPMLQSLWVLLVKRAFRVEGPAETAVQLFFRGHLPWLLLLMSLAGICLLAPSVWPVFDWLLSTRLLVVLVVVAEGWCLLLSYAFFRAGLALSRGRAVGAVALFYAGYIATLLVYFALAGQLAPILGILD